jgi:hypothetical protein
MEFVIATIPTVLAIEESTRLLKALRAEGVPTHSMVVNQVIGESMGAKFLQTKLKEQAAAMRMLAASPPLKNLEVIEGKLLDLEVRGIPALQYFASTLWQSLPLPAGGTGEGLVALGARLLSALARGVPALQCARGTAATGVSVSRGPGAEGLAIQDTACVSGAAGVLAD